MTIRIPDRIERTVQELAHSTGFNRSVIVRAMLAVAAEMPGAVISKIHDQL